ncbi:hypothetical protein [Calothrix sp. NIES-3974]|uniref:hypothetical protein n=1 Tax=Calothrix sp. NIES-3974 TaxID=2005462 RepID=UPI000B601DDC|nr:hypothetical protein [Calothrix sp. NIES-3974]BAZ06390.1 hypothetical protein NIES3974_30510 [Calothrix sp. NIES-3974]
METSSSRQLPGIIRQIITLVAIVGAFVINIISNIFPLGGETIGEISNGLFKDVLIIPANYAFAIWGLIYLGLFAFAIYQLLPGQRQNPAFNTAGYLITFASLAQIAWVYLFLLRQFVLSLLAMLLILVPLIAAYQALKINVEPVNRIRKWCVNIPIAIYLGWISVATIVNVACTLYALNWDGFGVPQIITVVMLLIATFLGDLVRVRRYDAAYAGVVIWALIAIAVRHFSIPVIFVTACACAIALLLRIFIPDQPRPVLDSRSSP